jgi:hypothetical protein
MCDDSETGLNGEAILSAIEDEERHDDDRQPPVDEFVAALTTVAGDCDDLRALDKEEGRDAAAAVNRHLADHEGEFLTAVRELDDRYAPYREAFATWIEYASSADNATKRWPFTLAEVQEGEEDRS